MSNFIIRSASLKSAILAVATVALGCTLGCTHRPQTEGKTSARQSTAPPNLAFANPPPVSSMGNGLSKGSTSGMSASATGSVSGSATGVPTPDKDQAAPKATPGTNAK